MNDLAVLPRASALAAVLGLAMLLPACAPPRWTASECVGQPRTMRLSPAELDAILGPMTDEQLLDLADCNMGTTHPSQIGFPRERITGRHATMPERILARLRPAETGLGAMEYVDLLREIDEKHPGALTPVQREEAWVHCVRNYASYHLLCKAFKVTPAGAP